MSNKANSEIDESETMLIQEKENEMQAVMCKARAQFTREYFQLKKLLNSNDVSKIAEIEDRQERITEIEMHAIESMENLLGYYAEISKTLKEQQIQKNIATLETEFSTIMEKAEHFIENSKRQSSPRPQSSANLISSEAGLMSSNVWTSRTAPTVVPFSSHGGFATTAFNQQAFSPKLSRVSSPQTIILPFNQQPAMSVMTCGGS